MIKLSDFQLQEQKTSYTCGYSSLSMVSHYFGNGVAEEELENELPIGSLGTTPSMFIKLFKRHLPHHRVMLRFLRKDKFITLVEKQIGRGIPLPMICFVKNKYEAPRMVGHYMVIIGIDKEKSIFYVADPFSGQEREVPFKESFKQLSFRDHNKENTMMLYKIMRLVVTIMGFMVYEIEEI